MGVCLCSVCSLSSNVVAVASFCIASAVENCVPYCILDLVSTRSPRSSPNESPRGSPVSRRRFSKQCELSVSEPDELYQTAMVRAQNGDVSWNEQFEM